jgi:low temperature requirement protein LtrA
MQQLTRDLARQEVSPLELFFDLVYVLALGQLSHLLFGNPTWTGAAEVAVLYTSVFTAWAYTSWAATVITTEHARARRMLLSVMLAGLFMNVAIPRAFEDAGWVFVIAFLSIQLGRTAWVLTVGLEPVIRNYFVRGLIWMTATAPLWLAGAAAHSGARLAWWGAAAVIDRISTSLAHPLPVFRSRTRLVMVATTHLLDRYRLFLIIALGEVVVTTGATLTVAPIAWLTLITGAVALSGTVALWWLYFRREEDVARRYLEQAEDPIRDGRVATYTLLVAVAGLITVAVGDAQVIAHPTDRAGVATNLMLFGGPALYIAGQGWYMHRVRGSLPAIWFVTPAVLAVAGVATLAVPAFIAAIVAAAIVIALAAAESRRSAREPGAQAESGASSAP